jgi:hypothetical protein
VIGDNTSISIDHGLPIFKRGVAKFNQSSNWFLGGLEDFETTTSGWFSRGFNGCIKSLVIQGQLFEVAKDSIRAANVLPCVSQSDYIDDNILDDNMNDFNEDLYLERGNRLG